MLLQRGNFRATVAMQYRYCVQTCIEGPLSACTTLHIRQCQTPEDSLWVSVGTLQSHPAVSTGEGDGSCEDWMSEDGIVDGLLAADRAAYERDHMQVALNDAVLTTKLW